MTDYEFGDPGVPAHAGESWGEAAERLRTKRRDWDHEIHDALDLYHAARKAWGTEAQLVKLAEECSELAAMASREVNGQAEEGELLQELVDARIMIEQVARLYTDESHKEAADGQLMDLSRRLQEVDDADQ